MPSLRSQVRCDIFWRQYKSHTPSQHIRLLVPTVAMGILRPIRLARIKFPYWFLASSLLMINDALTISDTGEDINQGWSNPRGAIHTWTFIQAHHFSQRLGCAARGAGASACAGSLWSSGSSCAGPPLLADTEHTAASPQCPRAPAGALSLIMSMPVC